MQLPQLRGELGPRAFSRPWTVVLALSGLLLLLRLIHLFARYALRRRSHAVLSLGPEGFRLDTETSVLGRTVVQRQLLVPLHNLGRLERLTRYPRLGFYAGLIALACGSYVGMQLVIEGLRGAPTSLELLLLGPVLIALGAGLDLFLLSLSDGARGQCRLRVQTRDGHGFEVRALDPPLLDALLAGLRERLTELAQQPAAAPAAQ